MESSSLETHSVIALKTLHEEMPETAWQVFKSIHIIITVVALIFNCLSLVVIYGLVSKLSRPLQLLSSLSFANMLAPWAVVTTYFPHTSCQEEIQTGLLLTAHNITALTLLALALSHYIATFKPLQYESILTCRKVWALIFTIWIASIVPGNLHFIVTLIDHNHSSLFCTQVYRNVSISLAVSGVIAGVTLIGTLASYTRITMYLRPIRAINRALTGSDNLNMPRKSMHGVMTGIILVVFFLIVWPPYIISSFEHVKVHNTDEGAAAVIAVFVSLTMILINCACNPVIYGLRMENVSNGYHRMYSKCRYAVSNGWSKIKMVNDRDGDQISSPLNPIESIC